MPVNERRAQSVAELPEVQMDVSILGLFLISATDELPGL